MSATLYNKKNCYLYVKLLLPRTFFLYAFCGTDITAGAQYATFTCGHCPGASIEYLNSIFVDNEVSHSVEITSWKRYLNFFTV